MTLPAGPPRGAFRGGSDPPPSKASDFTIVRPHGDGDAWVTDAGGTTRFLIFGEKPRIVSEASALVAVGPPFPAVVSEGLELQVGYFALLDASAAGGAPLLQSSHDRESGEELVSAVLAAASLLEAAGYSWEPFPTDIYWKPGGELVLLRARGARKLNHGEHLNAKRVMEALAVALLPRPFCHTTPALLRLLLPRLNFSTPEAVTLSEARLELGRLGAERTVDGAGRRVAELCDPGLRRQKNEDSTAVLETTAMGEPFTALIVCDGVSSSSRAGEASALAARTARQVLEDFAAGRLADGVIRDVSLAVSDAIQEAHLAICRSEISRGDAAPPGTTIVVAVIYRRVVTVGWVGDSRAYWIPDVPRKPELLTHDHSWVNDAVARGTTTLALAMSSPFAHALTRCLGPLDGAAEPVRVDVRTRTLEGPGKVILCTDGLWNYFSSAEEVRALVEEAGNGSDAAAVARYLVCRALADGGGDNVSVVVAEV
jgi:serine/threonine protein phosphatase PrpC